MNSRGGPGPVFRRWRLEAGLRQVDVQSKTGITQAYQSDLETGGIRRPGYEVVGKLLQLYGKTYEDLERETSEAAELQPVLCGIAA